MACLGAKAGSIDPNAGCLGLLNDGVRISGHWHQTQLD